MKTKTTRRAIRFPLRLEVKEINGQPVTDAYLLDLSAMGAKLESSIPLAPRNQMDLIFLLPGADTLTSVSGSVIWIKPVMAAPGRYHMGLKFFNSFWEIDQLGRQGKL